MRLLGTLFVTIFYVSTLGSDASSGTSLDSSFATLGRAVQAMASTGSADTTYVLDGTYYLNGTGLSLTGANSNDTIAAYNENANAIVSGGTPVTGWAVGSDGVWTAHLNVSDMEQLTLSGARQTEARYPNEIPTNPIQGGWLWAKALPAGNDPNKQMAYNPADFPSGQPAVGEKVSVFPSGNWASDVLTIAAVNASTGIITFDHPASGSIGLGSRYFISDSQVLLDQPGEWYFDNTNHTLYFKPPSGFDGSGAVASGDLSLVNISNAQNITIKGLTFADAATKAETGDFGDITTAAIKINSSSGIVVDGNHFINVAKGVSIRGSSHNNTFSNNNFSHTWSSAIEAKYGTSQNIITNNSIQNSNEVFAASGAIQLEETWGNTVSHNLIQNVPRFGISDFSWDRNVKSDANIIEYNTILHSGQTTDDTGAIYAYAKNDSVGAGNTIRYNKIIDSGGLGTSNSGFIQGQHWSADVYMDDGTSNTNIYGNFLYGSSWGGVFLHGGNNNDVWGNIIVSYTPLPGTTGGVGVNLVTSNGVPMIGNTIHNNIIELPTLSPGASLSFNPLIGIPSSIYQNIYFSPSGTGPRVGNMTFNQWLVANGDQGSSVVINPGFKAPPNDYSLVPGAYALTHGFLDLPWAQMGLSGSVDLIAPNVPSITSYSPDSGTMGDGITSSKTLSLTGAAEANSAIKIYDGATLIGAATANGSGAWTFSTGTLTDGVHSLTAKATDAAGNTSTASSVLNVTVGFTGSEFNDTLRGNSGNNLLIGLGGNDKLNGGSGADWMIGGTGNDTCMVDNLADVVDETSGDGNDTVRSSISFNLGDAVHAVGSIENLTLTGRSSINGTGNALDNVIIGNSANNSLIGGDGNDTLNGGSGADWMIGGTGNDTYVVNNSGDLVDETGGDGTDVVLSAVGFNLGDAVHAVGSIENLTLTGRSSINGTGNALDNVIIGNAGNNILTGLGGADWLDGGAGTDKASYAASAAGVRVSLVAGIIGAGGDAEADHLVNIENLTGSNFDDTLEGNAGNNVLSGGLNGTAGDTVSYAHAASGANGIGVTVSLATPHAQHTVTAGTDTLRGFENLTGSEFNDALRGNSGNNVLIGLAGNDKLTGAGGNDTFVFAQGFGKDTITDFVAGPNTGPHDIIQFDHTVFADFDAVIAAVSQVGDNTTITVDANDTITLTNVAAANLHAGEFYFT